MKIGLQNFQSIGEYTKIPIAPITLFYGPNSAGKSAVADAIALLGETLSGEKYSWDDFKKQLKRHGRSTCKSHPLERNFIGEPSDVVFTIEHEFHFEMLETLFKKLSANSDEEFFLVHQKGLFKILFPKATPGDVLMPISCGAGFEYQIYFSQWAGPKELINDWYLREIILIIDGHPFFKLAREGHSGPGFFAYYRAVFHTQHPSFTKLNKQFKGGLESALEGAFGRDTNYSYTSKDDANGLIIGNLMIGMKDQDQDEFPFGNLPLLVNSSLSSNSEEKQRLLIIQDLLNILLILPARCAAYSCSTTIIQPIRDVPNKSYDLHSLPIKEKPLNVNYVDRTGCWEVLANDIHSKSFGGYSPALDFVNNVLSSKDFLDTGYTITGSVTILVDIDDAISNLPNCNSRDLLDKFRGKDSKVHPYLMDQSRKVPVEITDVGVGISQVIPVLFACWYMSAYGGVAHIQQPELHLHPKLQAQLADVFIKVVHDEVVRIKKRYDELAIPKPEIINIHFLLESHSEHLLLRLLRRIRETRQTENPTKNIVDLGKVKSRSLKADQVAVVYVKKDKSGLTVMKHLRLADDGEFIDRWPDGFFTDRDIELFGDQDPFI